MTLIIIYNLFTCDIHKYIRDDVPSCVCVCVWAVFIQIQIHKLFIKTIFDKVLCIPFLVADNLTSPNVIVYNINSLLYYNINAIYYIVIHSRCQ